MDIEDFISKHQELSLGKFTTTSDSMDLYITDSLQDMLDMDIKTEMATDLGSAADFSDTLGLSFAEMPPLLDIESDNVWTTTSTNSSFVHSLDLYGSEANAVMVNPNSVMPSMFAETQLKKEKEDFFSMDEESSSLPSPNPEKSHLTFSPESIKIPKLKEEFKEIKKAKEEASPMFIYVRKDSSLVKKETPEIDTRKVKIAPSSIHTPLRIKPSPEVIKIGNKNCSLLNTNQKVTSSQHIGAKTIISGNIHILGAQQSRTILANAAKNQATIVIDNGTLNNNRQIIKTAVGNAYTLDNNQTKYSSNKFNNSSNYQNDFPKPAYSYSCLIAMALKNSRTGSLPVSEIYNFMCQHFPYFKTAPNGWKNSVRHNLSLNKCFEKIEKPATNGGQRKGKLCCLWAMNPSKIGKMDEEVLKWSRKDPQGIKKAMVYPDSLEALERGEMKYSTNNGASSDQDWTDGDEVDPDQELEQDLEETSENDDGTEPEGQEETDQELEVEEEIVNVDGSYRLLTNTHNEFATSSEELSDVDVDHTFDDFELARPFKVELAFDEDNEVPAKKSKTSFMYEPVLRTTTHTSRRKTPLVNRIA